MQGKDKKRSELHQYAGIESGIWGTLMVSHEKLFKEDFTLNDLKNSETVKNLMRAFAGESQARNRYTFAASQAKKEGLPVIQAVFSYTAGQEKEHAEIFYNYLKDLKARPFLSMAVILWIYTIRPLIY